MNLLGSPSYCPYPTPINQVVKQTVARSGIRAELEVSSCIMFFRSANMEFY